MKKVRLIFSAFALVLAIGAAFATSEPFTTEVWRIPSSGGICSETTCLLSGPIDCAVAGYDYYNNSSCTGSTISPKHN